MVRRNINRTKIIFARREKPGIASVASVVVLMILIISAGALIASLSIADSLSVGGRTASNKALDFARSGAKDALERIARQRDYTGAYSLETVAAGCSEPYAGCASVVVNPGLSPKVINIEGRIGNLKRKIQVAVNLDSDGLIINYDWQEE
jgi:hypothetical protein